MLSILVRLLTHITFTKVSYGSTLSAPLACLFFAGVSYGAPWSVLFTGSLRWCFVVCDCTHKYIVRARLAGDAEEADAGINPGDGCVRVGGHTVSLRPRFDRNSAHRWTCLRVRVSAQLGSAHALRTPRVISSSGILKK